MYITMDGIGWAYQFHAIQVMPHCQNRSPLGHQLGDMPCEEDVSIFQDTSKIPVVYIMSLEFKIKSWEGTLTISFSALRNACASHLQRLCKIRDPSSQKGESSSREKSTNAAKVQATVPTPSFQLHCFTRPSGKQVRVMDSDYQKETGLLLHYAEKNVLDTQVIQLETS